MDPMLEAFLAESRELLESAGQCFLQLEKNPDDPDQLNNLFRSMHTIKGSSGLFDIQPLTQVVHAAEDVLDDVREGNLEMTPDMVDLFLDTMDQVCNWLDVLEENGTLGDDSDSISQDFSRRLRSLISDTSITSVMQPVTTAEPITSDKADSTSISQLVPDWVEKVPDAVRQSIYQDLMSGETELLAIEYTPNEQCFFSGDDPLYTARQLPGLLWMGIDTQEPWPAVDEFDPYHCQLLLHMLVNSSKEDVTEDLRYVQDEINITPILSEQIVFPVGQPGEADAYHDFLEDAVELVSSSNWNALKQAIQPILNLSAPELIQSSALHWLQLVISHSNPDHHLVLALLAAIRDGEFKNPDPCTSIESGPDMHLDNEIKELIQAQLKILTLHDETMYPQGNLASVASIMRNLLPRIGKQGLIDDIEAALAMPVEQASEKVSRILIDLLESQNSEASPPADDALRDAAHELLLAQTRLLSLPVRANTWEGILESSAVVIRSVMNSLGHAKLADSLDTAVTEARNQRSGKKLQDLIVQMTDITDIKASSTAKSSPQASPSVGKDSKSPANPGEWDGRERRRTPVLKVDQARIDMLMDLIGELVVAKNALPYLANRAEQEYGCAPLAKAIKLQYAVINRIAEELQGGIMQVRMVPVSTVFQRFPRLVRDLSRKLGKQIKLVMEGEDTEGDKNVVEDLPDPMVHLIRNSIDHGIEMPDERKAAGKPVEGTIRLRAIQLDDQVMIEISDDGKGIDPDVIRRKAYEKGLIKEEQLDNMSDHDALQLILAPGFSTAETVTDLSGRGVGMDVVSNMVRKTGGGVVVESTPGMGSTVRLTLPLSMAVTRIMMVDTAGDCFGVPMDAITETVKLPGSSIQMVKNREMIVLRKRLIPLLHLDRALELEPINSEIDEIAILVVRVDGQELGLVVDRFHAGMDVILKPLEGVMSGFRHYSGTALLGDGRVLLVLNLTELTKCL